MRVILVFLKGALVFIFSKTIPKFFAFFALYFIVAEFTSILFDLIGANEAISNISQLFNGLPSMVLYFLSLFNIRRTPI
ncbi:hypothetical protein BKK51_08215 [Rodentibacter trehalosifermentans]|uniref:DUF2523 domain-containing protein n=1 Tax=Rodentibacter trehalosifermentans TaxID=1908263 RepID=A0A1V3IRV0_9PAST|nr:DUF2523 family protein [Rodentibacter trehalosifermentans]OOF44770.1 hypothetical protein BKK51_08215 [Rodentibacter trehalosifermentans]OOF45600.1 hypothetical protein BKK52_12370 [Rodentibacter trehalosifermentans]